MAELTHLKALLPRVMETVPRVEPAQAAYYIREAAIDFCMATRCWREAISQDMTADAEIVLNVPDYASIHAIENLHWQRTDSTEDVGDLCPISYQDAIDDGLDRATGNPRYFTQSEPGTVMILPRLAADAGTLKGSVFLFPKRADPEHRISPPPDPMAGGEPVDDAIDRFGPVETSENEARKTRKRAIEVYDIVPEYIVDKHGAAIVDGALSLLFNLPHVEDKGRRNAVYYEGRFMRAKSSSPSLKGEQRAPIRTRSQFF